MSNDVPYLFKLLKKRIQGFRRIWQDVDEQTTLAFLKAAGFSLVRANELFSESIDKNSDAPLRVNDRRRNNIRSRLWDVVELYETVLRERKSQNQNDGGKPESAVALSETTRNRKRYRQSNDESIPGESSAVEFDSNAPKRLKKSIREWIPGQSSSPTRKRQRQSNYESPNLGDHNQVSKADNNEQARKRYRRVPKSGNADEIRANAPQPLGNDKSGQSSIGDQSRASNIILMHHQDWDDDDLTSNEDLYSPRGKESEADGEDHYSEEYYDDEDGSSSEM